jgi:hypothetical protein
MKLVRILKNYNLKKEVCFKMNEDFDLNETHVDVVD